MTVTALLFASYADAFGRPSMPVVLPEGATVGEALERIRDLPGGASLPPAPLVAVNLVYARSDRMLRDGDELAVIPPVAGG